MVLQRLWNLNRNQSLDEVFVSVTQSALLMLIFMQDHTCEKVNLNKKVCTGLYWMEIGFKQNITQ